MLIRKGHEIKEATARDLELKVELIDNRLIALGRQIDDTEDTGLICKLIELRSNLLYKRRALKDRIENKTCDVMEYNITAVL